MSDRSDLANSPSPPPTRPTCLEDWESRRTKIKQLYEDRPLKEVIEIMEKEDGFLATLKQYKTMLERWGLGKNIRNHEMRAIVKIQARRQPKQTEFTVRDQVVPPTKINRFLKRTMGTVAPSPSAFSPLVNTPVHILYCTPASKRASPQQDGWLHEFTNIPSLYPATPCSLPNSEPENGMETQFVTGGLASTEPTVSSAESDPSVSIVLTQNGFSMKTFDCDLTDAFRWADDNGLETVIALLLAQKVQLPTNPECEEGSIIHLAVHQRDHVLVERILEHVVNPDNTTNSGWTPLHIAALNGDVAIVRLLLDHGADPNVSFVERFEMGNVMKKTPMDVAISNGHLAVAECLAAAGGENVAGSTYWDSDEHESYRSQGW